MELLSTLPTGEDPSFLADLGAAWVNLGCALQAVASRESLGEALDAFGNAIGFLEQLPFGTVSRFRHNLSAALANRADTFARIGTASSQDRAFQDYGRAISIALALPLDERSSFRILLASSWINLGNLHQGRSSFPEAVLAYDGAIAALGSLPLRGHRLACHHAATAWTNRGEALLSMNSGEAAIESAQTALAQVEGRDLDGPIDAKLSLRALRIQARALESLVRAQPARPRETVAQLTDVAERGLDIAFGGHAREAEFFGPFVAWFFSFGSRVYGQYQPQFLAEYLSETLGRLKPDHGASMATAMREISRQAAAAALESLGRGRLLVDGTPQTSLLMGTVKELRAATLLFAS